MAKKITLRKKGAIPSPKPVRIPTADEIIAASRKAMAAKGVKRVKKANEPVNKPAPIAPKPKSNRDEEWWKAAEKRKPGKITPPNVRIVKPKKKG